MSSSQFLFKGRGSGWKNGGSDRLYAISQVHSEVSSRLHHDCSDDVLGHIYADVLKILKGSEHHCIRMLATVLVHRFADNSHCWPGAAVWSLASSNCELIVLNSLQPLIRQTMWVQKLHSACELWVYELYSMHVWVNLRHKSNNVLLGAVTRAMVLHMPYLLRSSKRTSLLQQLLLCTTAVCWEREKCTLALCEREREREWKKRSKEDTARKDYTKFGFSYHCILLHVVSGLIALRISEAYTIALL